MNAAGKILVATALTGIRSAAQTVTHPIGTDPVGGVSKISRTVKIFVAGTVVAVGAAVAEGYAPQLVGSFATLILISSVLANIGGVLDLAERFTA